MYCECCLNGISHNYILRMKVWLRWNRDIRIVTLSGHSFMALFQGTPSGHSFRALFQDTPSGHSFMALFQGTPSGHSFRALLQDTPSGHSFRALLQDTPLYMYISIANVGVYMTNFSLWTISSNLFHVHKCICYPTRVLTCVSSKETCN